MSCPLGCPLASSHRPGEACTRASFEHVVPANVSAWLPAGSVRCRVGRKAEGLGGDTPETGFLSGRCPVPVGCPIAHCHLPTTQYPKHDAVPAKEKQAEWLAELPRRPG